MSAKTNIEKTASLLWLKRLAVVVVILLVFLTLLPEMLRFAANHWLNEQREVHSFVIDDIDLNLFSGEVGLKGIDLSGNATDHAQLESLYINLSMIALLQQRIEIEQFNLTGVSLAVTQNEAQDIFIAGIPLPASSSETSSENSQESAWGIGIQSLNLADFNLQFSSPLLTTRVELQKINVGAVSTWQPEQTADISLALKIQEAPLTVKGAIKPFAKQAHAQLKIELDQFPLSLLKTVAAEQAIEDLSGLLSLNLDVDARVDGPIQLKSELLIEALELRQDKHSFALGQIDWQGDLNYQTPTSETDLGLRIQGGLNLTELNVVDENAGVALVNLENLSLQSFELAQDQFASIKQIDLNKLIFFTKEKESLATLEAIEIHQLDYDGQQTLKIDKIDINTLLAKLSIDAEGKLPVIETMSSGQTDEPPVATVVEAEASPAWRVQLKQINLGAKSRIQFHDQSVSPPYKADISPLVISVRDIDTAASKQDVVIALSTEINQLTNLSLEAKVQPFGERINLTAEGELQNLDLPPLSPYAMKAMGYYLKQGQANALFSATVEEDQLDSTIKLKLNKFKIEAGDPDKVKSMNENLSMPLDLALDILRDTKDNIELELKVDGNISDPQFDVSQVINKAMGNATKFAAIYILKKSLEPWGTVFSVVSFLGKKITTPHFEAVEFSAGSSELNDEYKQYMLKMAALLNERPELELQICASASEQDRLALAPLVESQATPEPPQAEAETLPVSSGVSNQILLELAIKRMELVRQTLMEQGVDKARLFNCQPTMDDAEKAKPAVELYL